jgi:hypothetical protein
MDQDGKADAAGAGQPAPLAGVEPLPDWARFVPVALVATGALVITLFLHEPADEAASFWSFGSPSSSEPGSWWSSDEPSEPSEPSPGAAPVQSSASPQTAEDDETGR